MDESVVWWVQGKVIPYMSDYYSAPVSELLGGVACGRVLLLACVADFDCSATIQDACYCVRWYGARVCVYVKLEASNPVYLGVRDVDVETPGQKTQLFERRHHRTARTAYHIVARRPGAGAKVF